MRTFSVSIGGIGGVFPGVGSLNIDPIARELYVGVNDAPLYSFVNVYGLAASGADPAPVRTLGLSGSDSALALAIDPDHGVVGVLSSGGTLMTFPRTWTSDTLAPLTTISLPQGFARTTMVANTKPLAYCP